MLEAVGLVSNENLSNARAMHAQSVSFREHLGTSSSNSKISPLRHYAVVFISWPVQFNDFFRVYKPGL